MSTPVFNLGKIVDVPAGNDCDIQFTLYTPTATTTAAANSAVLAAADTVRFRMFTADNTAALLTATSTAASTNGTAVTIDSVGVSNTSPAKVTVKLDEDDMQQNAGVYHCILDVKDASDGNRRHVACVGTIRILAAPNT